MCHLTPRNTPQNNYRADAALSGTPSPEFADTEGVNRLFGLKQSLLYELLANHRIRAVSIRKPGRSRGKRLFDCNSIRAFLNDNVDVYPEVPEATQEESNEV
jgi:hypothetical protein